VLQLSRRTITLFSIAVFGVSAGFVWSLEGDGKTGAACRVEAKLSHTAEESPAFGKSLPDAGDNLDQYSILTNPEAPDYLYAVNASKKRGIVLFLASCEESKKSIEVLFSNFGKRTKPPFLKTSSIRPPRPHDYRRAPLIAERPKY
jgi:hypothetical protein